MSQYNFDNFISWSSSNRCTLSFEPRSVAVCLLAEKSHLQGTDDTWQGNMSSPMCPRVGNRWWLSCNVDRIERKTQYTIKHRILTCQYFTTSISCFASSKTSPRYQLSSAIHPPSPCFTSACRCFSYFFSAPIDLLERDSALSFTEFSAAAFSGSFSSAANSSCHFSSTSLPATPSVTTCKPDRCYIIYHLFHYTSRLCLPILCIRIPCSNFLSLIIFTSPRVFNIV